MPEYRSKVSISGVAVPALLDAAHFEIVSGKVRVIGGVGMADHGNELHTPDMALATHDHDATYVNEADHTKAAHDALNIDADTLDGLDSTALETPAGAQAKVDTHKAADVSATVHPNANTHMGASAPHSGHEMTTNKGVASGYASLDSGSKVPVAQLGTGTPDGTKFLRDDRSWQTAGGGGGGTTYIQLDLLAQLAAATWSNMPSAVTFFVASHRHVHKVDLTGCTEARLVVNKQATAGAATAKLILRYSTSFSTTVGNYSDVGTSEVSVAINVINNVLASAWIPLAPAAKADIFIALVGSGGNGALDPQFGNISAQFR